MQFDARSVLPTFVSVYVQDKQRQAVTTVTLLHQIMHLIRSVKNFTSEWSYLLVAISESL